LKKAAAWNNPFKYYWKQVFLLASNQNRQHRNGQYPATLQSFMQLEYSPLLIERTYAYLIKGEEIAKQKQKNYKLSSTHFYYIFWGNCIQNRSLQIKGIFQQALSLAKTQQKMA